MNTIREKYSIIPTPQKIVYDNSKSTLDLASAALYTNCIEMAERFLDLTALKGLAPKEVSCEDLYFLAIGSQETLVPLADDQGYTLVIDETSIRIASFTEQGLWYGCMTLLQILNQDSDDSQFQMCKIIDAPVLPNRGVMLDVSRGRVYTLSYLKDVAVLLSKMKLNVLQLYIEHTYEFSFLQKVHEGSNPLSAQEIRELDAWCKNYYIELQPNLQSFGHCNRLLTTAGLRHLRESDLYWTLSVAHDETYELLEKMYEEYLPNFTSPILNIDSDETYDLGSRASKTLMNQMGQGPLYLQHLLKVRELAKKQGKRLMVFGDVILHHPELLKQVPEDIIFLDWIYDPLPSYETPKQFAKAGCSFWVCPGTGAWNTLFPRQDGAYQNIMGLTLQGVANGAQGMLLCDWGDHGSYTPPAFSFPAFAVSAQASWSGEDPGVSYILQAVAKMLNEPALYSLHSILPAIHRLPAMWSKNRSQCVIALFDEPLCGRMITNPSPLDTLEALKPLPEDIKGVLDPESHHLMRPLFSISQKSLDEIRKIAEEARTASLKIQSESMKAQYLWLCDALELIVEKVRLGRHIRTQFLSAEVTEDQLLDWDAELRLMIRRYAVLQQNFVAWWNLVAKQSEIAITLTYFAHIIERLDYLRNWLLKQRQALETFHEVDYALSTYETAGYKSLPTY